jgi:hypothetical protein
MLRDFGATILILVFIGLLVGAAYFVVVAPCDPAVQQCLIDARK